jgi:DNA invertase Pin-like site-specific DNA recombinase
MKNYDYAGRRFPRGPPAYFYGDFQMKQKRVWIYTRLRGDTDQRAAQKARLLQDAMEHDYTVVGCSTDEADDYILYRPGLRAALRAVRKGEVDAVLVTRVLNISHEPNRLLRFMKKLQDAGTVLIAGNTDIEKELKEYGVAKDLRDRAQRKRLALPW